MSVTPQLQPMELRAVATIPAGSSWQYEPKWDGFRALAHRTPGGVALMSKNGQPLERYFPEIVAALERLPNTDFALDGELVVPAGATLDFDALQQRIHPAASRIARLAQSTPARYFIFDLLRLDGIDWIDRPLSARRDQLERFAAHFGGAGSELRLSPATRDRRVVDAWFERVGGALDGVVAKHLEAAYTGGKSDGGVKIKKLRTADCVIGGYRFAAAGRDRVGSLLLGLYNGLGQLDHIGFCSAFAVTERQALLERLAPYNGGPGFTGAAPDATPSRWNRDAKRDRSYIPLEPALVLEVAFDQVTGGRIRHGARPLRWRSDKSPQTCTTDQLAIATSVLTLFSL